MEDQKYHNWEWWRRQAIREFGMTNEQYDQACKLGDVINVMLGREPCTTACDIRLRVHPFVVFCIDGEHRGFDNLQDRDSRGYIVSRFTKDRAEFLRINHDHLLDIILGKKED